MGLKRLSAIRYPLGGAIGVSLRGIVLEWRLSVHGDSLTQAAISPARLTAFNEAFLMPAALCALAPVATWRTPPRVRPDTVFRRK